MTLNSQWNKPPRKSQSCGNCNAFLANDAVNPKKGDARQGWCRAAPPGLVETMQQHPLQPGQMVRVHQGVWPPTAADRWCRVWEADDDEPPAIAATSLIPAKRGAA